MNASDQKKIRHLHHLHKTKGPTALDQPTWLSTYFWDPTAKKLLTKYLTHLTHIHGTILTIYSQHPALQERTPIHLPFLYRHDITFHDRSTTILFQKYNFSKSFTSLFTSLTWSYIPTFSPTFRTHHREYEKTQHLAFTIVHPHPRSLWENYKTFLATIGAPWYHLTKKLLGPLYVVLTDVTAVTLAVPGKNKPVGISVYTHLISIIHQKRLQKKQLETLATALAKTIRSCYERNLAFIDVGLGNYIIDEQGRARFIDGELLQQFPTPVPSHYKALELVMLMETLYLETVRDYCRTINSITPNDLRQYQRGLLVFFSAFLKGLSLSKEELMMAHEMYYEWSTKVGTFYFSLLLSRHRDLSVIHRYRILLRKSLDTVLTELQ